MGTDTALKKTIKVCHIASGDLWAGAEAVLHDLLLALAADESVDAGVILLNEHILSGKLRDAGFDVEIVAEEQHGLLAIFRQLRKRLKRLMPDVVHTHRYKENILGGVAAKLVGVKHLVCTIHGMPEPLSGLKSLKSKLKFAAETFVFKRLASAIVAVSEDIARQVRPRVGKTPVVVIHNGIKLPQLAQEKEAAAQGRVTICTAGRLNPIKGYEYLIKATALLKQRDLDFELVIIGDGPLRGELEALAQELGAEGFVRFPGFNPKPLDVIASSDIFVLSSLHEGISIALLEALSLGKAVVVTNVGGNPEVVAHEKSGLLVPARDESALADAFARLLTDRELRRRLGSAGRDVIKAEFTDRVMAGKTVRLYKDLLESGRPQQS